MTAENLGRGLLQGSGPPPFASLGPQPDLPGLSVEAVLDLWGVGLLPFGLDMQQVRTIVFIASTQP